MPALLDLIKLCSLLTGLQMWNGLFFIRTTPQELGVRVQLGHPDSRHCRTSHLVHANFPVIHSNGIHHVNVDYCRCNDMEIKDQLLRIGWWPATPLVPKTAAMFEVLKHFHLNLQGKMMGYSFYHALEYQSDNTTLERPPVSSNLNNQLLLTHPQLCRINQSHSC